MKAGRKKKKLLFPFLALATALIFFVGSFWWWQWSLLPVTGQGSAPGKLFVIKKGESLSSIAGRLEADGLIRDSFAFKLLVLAEGFSGKIQAGDFRLSPSLTPKEMAEFLTHGSLDVWLTFPEGWRREEIAQRLMANLSGFDIQEFLSLTGDLEGYLFPDTYLIPRDVSPEMVVSIFQNNFEAKWTLDLGRAAQEQGLTQKQVLIFASIVEREARHEEDRPIVAGILLKRWRSDWPLQADATIQHAIASQQYSNIAIEQLSSFNWWPSGLTKADLQIDSPYNTYQHKGLPPMPICNPGLASIKAVVYPKETSYWFYLSDKEGQMHYAETAEGHNENISRYLLVP